jgi:hypothetical protein
VRAGARRPGLLNGLNSVTRNEPDTYLRHQNGPVSIRASSYTRSMKTAEIRGIPPELRGSGTAEIAIICSWFESRYPSSNRRRIPRRNHPSPLLPTRPETGQITRCDARYSIYGCRDVEAHGRVRACPARHGPLTVAPTHLLGMDATTQITATFLAQHEVAELLRLPERTLEHWRLTHTGPPYQGGAGSAGSSLRLRRSTRPLRRPPSATDGCRGATMWAFRLPGWQCD